MERLVLGLWTSLLSAEFASVCSAKAHSDILICYKCFKVPNHEACEAIRCSPNDTVCISHEITTTLANSRKFTKISKRCAPRCTTSNNHQEWSPQKNVFVQLWRQCCSKNYCNRAPPRHGAPWALLGGLLLLWALL